MQSTRLVAVPPPPSPPAKTPFPPAPPPTLPLAAPPQPPPPFGRLPAPPVLAPIPPARGVFDDRRSGRHSIFDGWFSLRGRYDFCSSSGPSCTFDPRQSRVAIQ